MRAYCEAGAACVATTAFECPPKLRFPPNREPSIEPPLAGPVGPAVPMVCLGYLVLPRGASVQRLGGLRGDLGVHQWASMGAPMRRASLHRLRCFVDSLSSGFTPPFPSVSLAWSRRALAGRCRTSLPWFKLVLLSRHGISRKREKHRVHLVAYKYRDGWL